MGFRFYWLCKRLVNVKALAVILLVVGILTWSRIDLRFVNKILPDSHQLKRHPTYVLYWRNYNGYGPVEGQDLGGCVVTFNKTRLHEARAVVFHRTSLDMETMPWTHYRNPDQIFVFFSRESPPYVRHNEHRLSLDQFDNGFINWTMTYRTDSDVFAPYLYNDDARLIFGRSKVWLEENFSKKKKIALWAVSNCDKMHGAILRMRYADALVAAGLPVDRYGKCYNNRNQYDKLSKGDLDSYKFYLAFENALHCKDYITEKFWRNGLLEGRVPVVWGPSKEDVKKLAPPDSYIHTEDFDSPASLASYLLYLDKNDTAYREYFRWLEIPDSRTEAFAKMYESTRHERLCEMVLSGQPRKTIDSISDYFYGPETEECFRKKL